MFNTGIGGMILKIRSIYYERTTHPLNIPNLAFPYHKEIIMKLMV